MAQSTIQESIYQILKPLNTHPQFILGNGLDDLSETLARGSAVDSIFFQKDESQEFDELRVWYRDGQLFTSPGIPLLDLLS